MLTAALDSLYGPSLCGPSLCGPSLYGPSLYDPVAPAADGPFRLLSGPADAFVPV